MVKFSVAQTTQATTTARMRMVHPGRAGKACCMPMMTLQAVSAPTIKTSPCAKLMRLMMPYTMV